ncbi:MAG: hypothetical protein J6A96_06305 [Clostridia bacterium]|nr:hypothetical protein [Clostridia bacterium]
MANKFNKEHLAQDVFNILKGSFSEYTQEKVLDGICWAITERKELEKGVDYKLLDKELKKAKIKGCRYWSKAAFEDAFEESNGSYTLKKGFNENNFTHEHVIPKAIIKASLQECVKNCDSFEEAKEKIIEIFDCSFACVLTKEEADLVDKDYKDSMPSGATTISKIEHPWERYCNKIENIYDVTWSIGRGWIFSEVKPNAINVKEYKFEK